MRLAIKVMSLVLVVIVVVLSVDGYLSVQREVKLFLSGMKHDAHFVGQAIKGLVVDVWQTSGQERALALIARANNVEHQIRIRWVWLEDQAAGRHAPQAPPATLEAVVQGKEVCFEHKDETGTDFLYTYVPVRVEAGRTGALELSESMSRLSAYAHDSFVRILILAGVILLAATFVLVLASSWLIQRPLDQLVKKTRRIGAGDLSGTLQLSGRDELAKLATEINRMCRQIDEAQEATRSETEQRLAALEQLRHAERLTTLGRLSAGVAHELGTPLNVVAGRAKLITDPAMTREEVVESAGIIREQAGRMTKIIQDLLNFARRRRPKKAPADLETIARHVVKMLEPAARKNGVELRITTTPALPLITVDEVQMEQVLMNLVMNGIEAMPEGGIVAVKLSKDDRPDEVGRRREYLVISVTDEGEGIAGGDLHHIFEPFFTRKDVGKGSGLGLSIAHGIVEEHDGWIEVKSEPGKGAAFAVFLPWEEQE